MSEEPNARFVGLGAGVQSTTMILLAAEGVLPKPDGAIFADTGWEPAAVYAHLDRLEREVMILAGIPLYRVSNGNLRDDVLDPNKMRSIPAYTASVPEPVTVVDTWRPCPATCGWLAFNEKWDPDGMLEFDWSIEGTPLEEVYDRERPADCPACSNQGSVADRTHTEHTQQLGMLNRRCTQLYKLNPVLGQVRLLLGAKVGEAKECRFCQGTGERVAPWRAKRGESVVAECSVCRGDGVISRIGQPPAGAWSEQWIGFSTDEVLRVSNRGDTRYSRSRYPLLELGMSRAQCESYLAHNGWGTVAKSACIGCPFHGNAAWRQMRDNDPESWADAVKFDAEYRVGAGMNHQRFLHISRKPLGEAPIEKIRPGEWQQTSILDAVYDAGLAEGGEPDGCSPYGCRSGSAAVVDVVVSPAVTPVGLGGAA